MPRDLTPLTAEELAAHHGAEAKATPGPWSAEDPWGLDEPVLLNPVGEISRMADAAFIALAVNDHARLVAGCEEAARLREALDALRNPKHYPATGAIPCLCGGMAGRHLHVIATPRFGPHHPEGEREAWAYAVGCGSCAAQGPWVNSVHEGEDGGPRNAASAVRAWNHWRAQYDTATALAWGDAQEQLARLREAVASIPRVPGTAGCQSCRWMADWAKRHAALLGEVSRG